MAKKTRSALKTDNDTLFQANGNQAITATLHNDYNEHEIDSAYNVIDDKLIVENQYYNTNKSYLLGDLCIYEDRLLVCSEATTGTFDATKWTDYDVVLPNGSLQSIAVSSNSINLSANRNKKNFLISGSGVITLSSISGGISGRTYRFYLNSAITNLSLTDQTPTNALSNGTGELCINRSDKLQSSHIELVGNEHSAISDWFEVVYWELGTGEYFNSVVRIQKHTP